MTIQIPYPTGGQRTSAGQVQAILGKEYDADARPDIQPFIATATVLTDRVYALSVQLGKPLSPGELERIECFLAAHFYQSSDPAYTSRSTGGASGSFLGQGGLRLEKTRFGQDALLIDYSGALNIMNKRQTAKLTWVGKPVSQQIPYNQRD